MAVQFREKSIGQHGANSFYKEFTVSYNSNYKTYRLGSFYFVHKAPNPVTIAEFQLIWKNTYTGKKYVSVKLYFNPEHDDGDESDEECPEEFGKDEVIEADRQVVIECAVFPFWECSSKLWDKKIGEIAFADVPWEYIKKIIKEGSFPTDGSSSKECEENIDVKVISYPQYCRFKACKQLIKIGVPMTLKVFMARGGMILKNINTLIVFSRWKFSKSRIDDFSLTRNITVPMFKGRPPKKKRQELMLLKKKKQNLLMKELNIWKLSTKRIKRAYKKRGKKDSATQDGHSSVSSAASRIIKKYRKKCEKTELTGKKDEKSFKNSHQKYRVPNERKATDGRLKINKLKKATLLKGMELKIEIENTKKKYGSKKEEVDDAKEVGDKKNVSDNNVTHVANKEKCKKESGGVDDKDKEQKMKMFAEPPPREEFIKELYAFMDKENKPIVFIPSMGRAQVDFYDLYTLVVKYGGYEQVTSERRWREVYYGLGRHSSDNTNAATSVRKIYENTLLPYENKMRKKDAALPDEIEGLAKVTTEPKASTEQSSEECKRNEIKSDASKTPPITEESYTECKRNHVENKPIPLDSTAKPCEYKRISSAEESVNKPLPVTYVSCENNIIQKNTNSYMLEKVDVSSSISHAQKDNTDISTSRSGGTTSFTLQAGGAFKVMIQKRRGRPSKDFLKQIEQLKTMNRKVEVEVFPPSGKRARIPTWLNELNVDIVNPRGKRKLSALPARSYAHSKVSRRYAEPKVQMSPLSKREITRVTNVSHHPYVNNSYETGPCTPSILKIETPSMCKVNTLVKSPNGFPEILPKSPNGYVSMVAINSEDKTSERLRAKCNNQDVDSNGEISTKSASLSQPYVYPPHPITIPQSVLTYKQYIPKYVASLPTCVNESSKGMVPRYSISSSSTSKELTAQTYRKNDLPKQPAIDKIKSPTSTSFDSKIRVPDIRRIYMPNNEKRMYTSNHHVDKHVKRDNMEQIYIHRSSDLKTSNGKPCHEPVNRFSHGMTIISAQRELKVCTNNVVFHSYAPSPSNVYMSPTTTICKNITGACTGSGAGSKPSLETTQTTTAVEPTPKVYILPSERT